MITYNKELNLKIKHVGFKSGEPVYEEDIASTNILVIGNGFDLRAGVNSLFKDFIFYVIYGCALHNLNTDTLFSEVVLTDYIKIDTQYPYQLQILLNQNDLKIYKECSKFAESSLGQKILNHLFTNETFCNLIPFFDSYIESRVFTKEDLDSIKTIYGLNPTRQNQDLKLPHNELNKRIETLIYIVERERKNLTDNLNLESWLDIESVIEMIVTGSDELVKKYGFEQDDTVKQNPNVLNGYLRGLDLFELLLAKYLKAAQIKEITADKVQEYFDTLKDSHIHSLRKRSHGRIIDFDISNPDVIINYNYTDIAKKYYVSLERKPKIIHINGSLNMPEELSLKELDTNIVIGYTNSSKCHVPKEAFPFEKSSRRIIKNTEYVNINNLIGSGMFDLIIYGHSCGIADSDVISKLLSSDGLKTAVVLCHTYIDLVLAFNNIKAMLTEKKFNELMTFSEDEIYGNLYFSVENVD